MKIGNKVSVFSLLFGNGMDSQNVTKLWQTYVTDKMLRLKQDWGRSGQLELPETWTEEGRQYAHRQSV